jgi:hypothetical protein
LIFYAKTYPKIQTGHPFDKTYSVNSSLSEDVFKKCGKQEPKHFHSARGVGYKFTD